MGSQKQWGAKLENNLTGTYTLDYFKRTFAEARDMLEEPRKEARIDDDYYHGYQLTAGERKVLRDRFQPDGIFNRVRKAVNGTLGVLKQGESDPRAFPREPGDEAAAEVATKVLRYVADLNRIQARRIDAGKDYLVSGSCAALIEVDGTLPLYTEIHAEEFFHDPRSRKADFRDARYLGIAKWMFADDVASQWPESRADIDAAISMDTSGGVSDTFNDRPSERISQWVDSKYRRLMVVEIYCRHGDKWLRALFHGGGFLAAPSVSPYLRKRRGRVESVCPIVAQTCYIDRENNRYGIIRDMRAPQDDFNKRRQKLLHMLNNRQVQANNEIAFNADAETVRNEASRPDGVLPPGWQPVSINDLAGGQFNLLAMAEAEMDREGPNPAVLARGAESASGRAQMVRQQAGLTEQATIFGGFEDWEHRIYEALWDRAVQFMNGPEWIRITDDQGAPEFLQVNKPMMAPTVIVGPDGQPMAAEMPVGIENEMASMDVDITLDTVPDTANLAQEQFMALVDLARAGVPIDPIMLLEASSLPKKREIIERMQQQTQPQQPSPQEQLAMAAAQAAVEKTQSETARNMATAQATMANVQIDAFEAGMTAAA